MHHAKKQKVVKENHLFPSEIYKKKHKKIKTYLPYFFSGHNRNHTYIFFIWRDHFVEVSDVFFLFRICEL